MNRIKHWFVVTALLVGASACMSTPEEESPSVSGQELSSGDSTPLLQGWSSNISIDNAQLDQNSGEVSITADCAFIEWCNRPASISPNIGTVCRLRPGCTVTAATVAECDADVAAVCGAAVLPKWICRQGFTCPPG